MKYIPTIFVTSVFSLIFYSYYLYCNEDISVYFCNNKIVEKEIIDRAKTRLDLDLIGESNCKIKVVKRNDYFEARRLFRISRNNAK